MGNGIFSVMAVMNLADNITGPLGRIRGSLGATQKKTGTLSARMSKLAKDMAPVGIAAGIIVAGMFGTINSTIATQKALGELGSVGVTNFAAMENAAEDFSATWAGTTKDQFITAAYDIKSGISSLTDDGVAQFTRLAALTGKATKSTTAEMTNLFATGYGIYKGTYEDLSDMQFGKLFSAGIAASVKNFKTTGSGMAQAISQLGAEATNAKIPLQEQLSVLGMLQATMSGSEAGTKYKAFAQSAAAAGEKLRLSFVDTNNQLLSMPGILEKLKGRYGDTIDAIEKQEIQKAFGTKEATAVIDLFYNKIGDLKSNIDNLSGAMGKGTGFTSAMAMTMNKDLGAVLQIIYQRIHNLMEIAGKKFMPAIAPLLSVILVAIGLLTRFAKNPIGGFLIKIVGLLAVVITGIMAFAGAVAGIGMILPAVTAAFGVLAGMIGAVAWPVWVIIGVVYVLWKVWQRFSEGIINIWNTILLVAQGVWAVFTSLKNGMGSIKGALSDKIEAAGLLGVVTAVSKVIYKLHSLGKIIFALPIMFFKMAGTIYDFLTGKLNFYEAGKKILLTLKEGILSVALAPVMAIKGVFGKIRRFLPFSDAIEGPLSDLTLSGQRVVGTLADGMKQAAPQLAEAAEQSFDINRELNSKFNIDLNKNEGKNSSHGSRSYVINIKELTLKGVNNAKTLFEELSMQVEGFENV